MKISVIGTGYVGTVSAACFAELGHDVICVDVDKTKIDQINAGISPIYEEGLSELLEKHAGKNSRIKTVHRHSEPGFGNAVREGFKNATGDIVIPVMGDLSDDPQDVPKLVRKIDEGYDIAYGSRFIEGGATEGYPWAKMIANRTFNNVVRLLFGIKHKDITNAFKAYRKKVLESISIEANGFDLTVEVPLKAHIMGFTSAEVPVGWHGR